MPTDSMMEAFSQLRFSIPRWPPPCVELAETNQNMPKTIQIIANALICPPETAGENLLLKTHFGHRTWKHQISIGQNASPCWKTFLVPEMPCGLLEGKAIALLRALLTTILTRYTYEYNISISVMGITNYFLIEIKACSTRENICLEF